MTIKVSKFFVLTDQRIIFYSNGKPHSIPYGKVYKLSHWGNGNGVWFINGLPTFAGCDETLSTSSVGLTPEQVGMILAIICRGSIEQRGLHKIVVNVINEP